MNFLFHINLIQWTQLVTTSDILPDDNKLANFSPHIFIRKQSVKDVQYTYQSYLPLSLNIKFNIVLENQESMGHFSRDARELSNLQHIQTGSPLWSSGQSLWLQIQRSRVRFPALPDFLSSSGSGTESTHPREVN